MKFIYKVQDEEGKILQKEGEFASKEELFNDLHLQKLSLISAHEVKGRSFKQLLEGFSIGGIKEEQKIMFARNLSAMIEAGLPMSRALGVMERQARSKKLKDLISDLISGINTGKTMSDMMQRHPKVFSSLFISMVRAGEESGNIVGSFKVVADQLERSYKLKKKVKGAMMYPGIIISAMVLIGVLMMIFVVPTLTATFKELEVDLPASTQFIIFLSDLMKNNSLLVFVFIAAAIFGFISFNKSAMGKRVLGKVWLKIPVIGSLVREVNAARTASTLSSLLLAGVEVIRSIEITQDVLQNVYYKKILAEMKEKIKVGGLMSETFKKHENLYPPLVGEMVAVGEETGKLSELLQRVAEFYESDVDERTKNMSTIIEPFLMVLIGGVVGFFALSMISPMYSLGSSI